MVPRRKQETASSGTDKGLGGDVTRQELEDVLVDGGYSADRRKGRLKEILTRLVQEQTEFPNGDREAMIEEVKAIIDEHQHGKPIAEDILRKRRQ
jgi:hypothetical protein